MTETKKNIHKGTEFKQYRKWSLAERKKTDRKVILSGKDEEVEKGEKAGRIK
jgi:hypothetical protein